MPVTTEVLIPLIINPALFRTYEVFVRSELRKHRYLVEDRRSFTFETPSRLEATPAQIGVTVFPVARLFEISVATVPPLPAEDPEICEETDE